MEVAGEGVGVMRDTQTPLSPAPHTGLGRRYGAKGFLDDSPLTLSPGHTRTNTQTVIESQIEQDKDTRIISG